VRRPPLERIDTRFGALLIGPALGLLSLLECFAGELTLPPKPPTLAEIELALCGTAFGAAGEPSATEAAKPKRSSALTFDMLGLRLTRALARTSNEAAAARAAAGAGALGYAMCGKCKFCLDKPRFGGNGTLKRPCANPIKAPLPDAAARKPAQVRLSAADPSPPRPFPLRPFPLRPFPLRLILTWACAGAAADGCDVAVGRGRSA
jgi:hypothetical protein